MKKIILLALLVCVPFISKAQALTLDVDNLIQAVEITASLGTIGETMTSLTEINEEMKKLTEFTTFLDKTASLGKIIQLIDQTVCVLDSFEQTFKNAQELEVIDGCIDQFKFRAELQKIILTADNINLAIKPSSSMEPADRWKLISSAFDTFVNAQISLSKFDTLLTAKILKYKENEDIGVSAIDLIANYGDKFYQHYSN